jgi:hypothetical protein
MTLVREYQTPEYRAVGALARDYAIVGRALEELVADVDVADTRERLELKLYELNGEGPDVDVIRDAIDLLHHLARRH